MKKAGEWHGFNVGYRTDYSLRYGILSLSRMDALACVVGHAAIAITTKKMNISQFSGNVLSRMDTWRLTQYAILTSSRGNNDQTTKNMW
jgi:hypothetical protein